MQKMQVSQFVEIILYNGLSVSVCPYSALSVEFRNGRTL